jgi:hypothetical protein
MMWKATHKKQYDGAEEREVLDGRMVKWVINGLWVFVVAMVTLPRFAKCRKPSKIIRTTLAYQLELYRLLGD